MLHLHPFPLAWDWRTGAALSPHVFSRLFNTDGQRPREGKCFSRVSYNSSAEKSNCLTVPLPLPSSSFHSSEPSPRPTASNSMYARAQERMTQLRDMARSAASSFAASASSPPARHPSAAVSEERFFERFFFFFFSEPSQQRWSSCYNFLGDIHREVNIILVRVRPSTTLVLSPCVSEIVTVVVEY